MLIIPSILTQDPNEARELLKKAEEAGVKRVQIDVVDGKFANNKTVDPVVFRNLETNILLDYHLMVDEPINWVEKCLYAGADRIIAQIEKMTNQFEFLAKVQSTGSLVGLAIDITTPVNAIEEEIIKNLDVVLVMSVPAGFGSQKFDFKALDKIKKLNKIRKDDQSPFKICVDGGITKELTFRLENAGADEATVGGKRFFEQFMP